MLNIQINEDYKITSSADGQNIMIEKQIYKEDEIGLLEPTGRYKVDGYFGRNLSAALKGLVKLQLSDYDATTMQEIIDYLDAVEKRIHEVVSKLNIEHTLDTN